MENQAHFFENEIASEKPTYFIHPHNKFWQVEISAEKVTYRAGKMRNRVEITSEIVQKKYSSDYAAKRTVKDKIRQKMVKGYIVFQASKSNLNLTKNQIDTAFQGSKPNINISSIGNQIQNNEEKAIKQATSAADKKQQKQQKKKIKTLIQQLDQRSRLSANYHRSISTNKVQSVQLQTTKIQIKLNDKYPNSKNLFESTFLLNNSTKEGIKYEVMQERKVQVTKYLAYKNCGYQIKSFGSNQQVMKFIFGQRQWLKSQGYSQEQFKQCPQPSIVKTQGSVKREMQYARAQQKKKSKLKNCSLVSQTDELLVQVKKLVFFDNEQNNNREEPMLGPPTQGMSIKLMLAESWKQGADPKGWLMSQKLDGVRCYWTGTEMHSRNGNRFQFPNFFTKNWPKTQLDGELFIGRGKFSHTMSAVKRLTPVNSMWQQVRYLVFDAPGLKCPFKQRHRLIKQVISKADNPYIKCHYHRQCKGFQDLFHELDHINKVQGQGLMLRDPDSLYQFRRSKALLKVKTFHDDEATILGYNEGTGRFVGHVGSLKCINKAGANFDVGSGLNDEMRFNPPKVGQKIVYKYQQLNKDTGRPRFPTFLRMFQDDTTTATSSTMGWVRQGQTQQDNNI